MRKVVLLFVLSGLFMVTGCMVENASGEEEVSFPCQLFLLVGICAVMAMAFSGIENQSKPNRTIYHGPKDCPTCNTGCANNATSCPKCGHNF